MLQALIQDSALSFRNSEDSERLKNIFESGRVTVTRLEATYDRETQHGKYLINQVKWDTVISERLENLKDIDVKIFIGN